MQLINNLNQSFNNYWNDIPADTHKSIIYCTVGAFLFKTVLTKDPVEGAVYGLLCGTASAVYALVTPFFKAVTGKSSLSVGEEICKKYLSLIISYGAITTLGLIDYQKKIDILFGITVLFVLLKPSFPVKIVPSRSQPSE